MRALGVETQAMSASPHQLICMLFDGAATAIGMARHHMAGGDIAAKGKAISKAIAHRRQRPEGRAGCEGGRPRGRPSWWSGWPSLYDYVIRRLLQANLHDDPRALDEAEALLENVASAWREIDAGGAGH